jgi:hypothetical protein
LHTKDVVFQGRYENPGISLEIPPANLPAWMMSGKYWFKVDMSSGKKHFGCIETYLKLH